MFLVLMWIPLIVTGTYFYFVLCVLLFFVCLQRKKDAEQKKAVKANQREFVMKMLPVIDAFRQAPLKAPGTTEREQNMHKNFGSLLSSIMTVIEKFGFKEFQPGMCACCYR